VFEQSPVVVYELGYDGLSIYVQFCETVPPQLDTETTQQTPKDAAQFPSAVPRLLHSVAVIHVPFSPDVETALHSPCLNDTMLNKENCFESFSFVFGSGLLWSKRFKAVFLVQHRVI
jgi:hypothetical protein